MIDRRYRHRLPIGISPFIGHQQAVICRAPHARVVVPLVQNPGLIGTHLRRQRHARQISLRRKPRLCPRDQIDIIRRIRPRYVFKIEVHTSHVLCAQIRRNIVGQICLRRGIFKNRRRDVVVKSAFRIQRCQHHHRAHPGSVGRRYQILVRKIHQIPLRRKTVTERRQPRQPRQPPRERFLADRRICVTVHKILCHITPPA